MEETILLHSHFSRTDLLELILVTFELILLFAYLHNRRVQQVHTRIILYSFLSCPSFFLVVTMMQLLPTSLEMRKGNFGVCLLETHCVTRVVSTMLGHQLPYVLQRTEEEFPLLRDHLFAHQQYQYNNMEEDLESVRQTARKNMLIQQILNMQQELQALEDRSQDLQHENNFYQEKIEELKIDIDILRKESQK